MQITGMWCLIDKFQEIVYVFPPKLKGRPTDYVKPPGQKLVFLRFEDEPSKPPRGLPRPRAVKIMKRKFTEVRKGKQRKI